MVQPGAVPDDEILPEYSLKGAVRGKYADRYARDATVVVLDPDVAEVFRDDESVNRALRALAQIIRDQAANTAARPFPDRASKNDGPPAPREGRRRCARPGRRQSAASV